MLLDYSMGVHLALELTNYVTLDKVVNFSMPQCLHL